MSTWSEAAEQKQSNRNWTFFCPTRVVWPAYDKQNQRKWTGSCDQNLLKPSWNQKENQVSYGMFPWGRLKVELKLGGPNKPFGASNRAPRKLKLRQRPKERTKEKITSY